MALSSLNARAGEAALSTNWGVQLYTLSDVLPTRPADTLNALSAMGYREVEILREKLDLLPLVYETGLRAPAMHIEAPTITGDWTAWKAVPEVAKSLPPPSYGVDAAIADAKKHGIRFLVVSYLMPGERTNLDFYRHFIKAMNQAGEKCRAAGLELCYHHHGFEFKPLEGKPPMDLLVAGLDARKVGFEIDVFWVSISGHDPVKVIRNLGPRVRLLHLKDKAKGTANEYDEFNVKPEAFTEVGSGEVDFKGVIVAAKAAGVAHAFVEQDHRPGDPLDSLKKSYDYLKALTV
jgi:sugar phosphate isomerase/epimerase